MRATAEARNLAGNGGEAQVASQASPLRRILYVEQNRDGTTGGSYRSLLFLLKGLDQSAYTPIVAFYREHELLGAFRAVGCETLLLRYPSSIDLTSRLGRLGAPGRMLLPLARIAQKILNLPVSIMLVFRNAWLLVSQRIDLLHLNNSVTVGAELLIAAKLLGLKCVIHQRGIVSVPFWCRWLARRADDVICVSDAARDNLLAQGLPPAKTTVIYNGIDVDALRRQIQRDPGAVRAAIGIRRDAPVVGLAGMIRPWKGQMVLVKAMDRLHRTHPELQAIIMGGVAHGIPMDVAYLNAIHAYIREHQLEQAVLLLDHQPNAPELLQVFDIMVHTAIEPEPFSRVVIEGMALARPIVASATGGTPEAIEHGVSGLLVPPDDPGALADSIELLLQRTDLRETLGRRARETVERRFHIRSHVARTQAIYARLLGDTQAR